LLGALEAHEVAWDPRVGQAEVAALNARDAGSAAQTSARDAARDAQSRAQNSTGREYQVLSQALDMLANQAHPQIFVTYPSASPAIIQYGSTPAAQVATGERKIPVLLDLEACFVEPPPGNNSSTNEKSCDVSISKWDEKFLSPPTIIVKLTNNSKYDLEFLDFDAILETVRRSDTGGLRGICSPPRGGYQPWKMGESKANNVVLKLAPIRTSKERKNAKNEWAKGEVYLTLCTTIRLPGSIPILDRSVYHVKLDDKNTGVLDSEPDEREAVLLQ
jgi:hypothetical protein